MHHVVMMPVSEIHRNREKVKKRKETQTDELAVFRSMASVFAQEKKIKAKPQAQIPLKTKQTVTKLFV